MKIIPTDNPFPANLFIAAGALDSDEPLDALKGTDTLSVYAALAAARLTDRETKIILMRYKNGLDMLEVGKHFCVTRERIRQVENKALRKLGMNAPRGILTSGLMAWVYQQIDRRAVEIAEDRITAFKQAWLADHSANVLTAQEAEEQDEQIALMIKPIEELELSIRSYNCLKRSGVNTVGEITAISYERLLRIRNLGRRSADEICTAITRMGLKLAEELNEE